MLVLGANLTHIVNRGAWHRRSEIHASRLISKVIIVGAMCENTFVCNVAVTQCSRDLMLLLSFLLLSLLNLVESLIAI